MLVGHEAAAGVAQGVLQQHPDGEGKPVEVGESLAAELRQPVHDGGLAAELEGAACAERIAESVGMGSGGEGLAFGGKYNR